RQSTAGWAERVQSVSVIGRQRPVSTGDLLELADQGQGGHEGVAPGVIADSVPFGDDPAYYAWMVIDEFSHQEERRGRTMAPEDVQDLRRMFRIRSVVEREVQTLAVGRQAGDHETGGENAEQAALAGSGLHGIASGGFHLSSAARRTPSSLRILSSQL